MTFPIPSLVACLLLVYSSLPHPPSPILPLTVPREEHRGRPDLFLAVRSFRGPFAMWAGHAIAKPPTGRHLIWASGWDCPSSWRAPTTLDSQRPGAISVCL
ncbi:hypothetical protein F5Y15DRAFT_51569 [Xylariaceae sp. FL0016]|nr:hypothetical protein F5Y15DRAFT_51569 [Xylariaceae sp. FL0016]